MFGLIAGAVAWLLSKLFGKPPGPSQEAQATAAAAIAQTNLNTEGQALAELQAATAARAAADARRVHDDPTADHVTTDPAAAINTNPDDHFRD